MKIGEETICYQHQQAQNILEKLLKLQTGVRLDISRNQVNEIIEWITKANDSAIRMEDKLRWYKENENKS